MIGRNGSLYNHFPVGYCCTIIRLLDHTVSLLSCKSMYVWIYLLLIETMLSCNRLVLWFCREMIWSWQSHLCLIIWFYIFGENYFFMTFVLFIGFGFNLCTEVNCSLNLFHLWYRINCLSQENFYYMIWYWRETTAS